MLFNIFGSKTPAKLPFHTDIHCHVVPGVDDGSPDADTSVMLLSRMADMGLTRIFASPHSTQDTFENTLQSLAEPFAQLQKAVADHGLDISLAHHAEYRLDEFFIGQLNSGNIISLPGNLLLVENSFNAEPFNLESLLFDIRLKGYTPILAHPERYKYYSLHHRDRYRELFNNDLKYQINLLSLAGHHGKHEREVAVELLKNGMVEYIGTDIHRLSHVESIERYLNSSTYKRDLKLFSSIRNDEIQ